MQQHDVDDALQRISYVLDCYTSWLSQNKLSSQPPSVGISEAISNYKGLSNYDNTNLLNDFHYITRHHDYHSIYLFLASNKNRELPRVIDKDGNLSIPLHRNYRNRNRNDDQTDLYFGYNEPKEIATQQILDSIYCYCFHSYDLKQTLRPNEQSILDDHIQNYQKQLNENENIELSKTAQRSQTTEPLPLPRVYNQKIEFDSVNLSQSHSESDDNSQDDSMSITPQILDFDHEERKSAEMKISVNLAVNTLAPSAVYSNNLTPSASSRSIKPKRNGYAKELLMPRTPEEQMQSKLMKKIKASNSKIFTLKQILQQNADKNLFLQLGNKKNGNKFMHILKNNTKKNGVLVSTTKLRSRRSSDINFKRKKF